MRGLVAALALLALLGAACTVGPGNPVDGSPAEAASSTHRPTLSSTGSPAAGAPSVSDTTPAASPPVDASIEPVSLSDLTPEAAGALRICQVLDNIGADKVSGMGRIAHARDAVRYAPLTGVEPEIQTDAPAWLVTFRGEVPMPMNGEIWIDPTCIVVGGGGGFYATGPVKILLSGVMETPLPAKRKPDLALPPLLP